MSIRSFISNQKSNGVLTVVDHQQLSSNTTSITFRGLNLNEHGFYLLYVHGVNTSGGNLITKMRFNGDSTDSRYYRQRITADGTTVAGARTNDAGISSVDGNENIFITSFIFKTSSNTPIVITFPTRGDNLDLLVSEYVLTYNQTTNITSIELNSGIAGGYAAGSRFVIMRLV